MTNTNQQKQDATDSSTAGTVPQDKTLHVTYLDIHELAVFAHTHTINAVKKYAEFTESASKAYPALLELEKRFSKLNGRPTDLGEGYGVIGWYDFLKLWGIEPGTFRVWKSRMKASLELSQRKQTEAAEKLLRDAERERKVRLAVALKAQEEAAERVLIDAKAKLAVMDETMDAETLATAKDIVEAAEQVTEAIRGKILEFTPKSGTGAANKPALQMDAATPQPVKKEEYILLAAELSELILAIKEKSPSATLFAMLVKLAKEIKESLKQPVDQPEVPADFEFHLPNLNKEPLKHGRADDATESDEKTGRRNANKKQQNIEQAS